MVPELASAAAAETEELRAAAVSAAEALPSRWIAVGAAPADGVHGPATAGTFAGYGVDVRVGLAAGSVGAEPAALPLCVLIAAWLRGVAGPQAGVEAHAYRTDHDPETAVRFGRQLRAQIDAAGDEVGVLVVADGVNTLTPSAPGGYDPDSLAIQAALDDALAAGDVEALARVPATIVGRVAYQVLAGLAGAGPRSAKELYRGAPVRRRLLRRRLGPVTAVRRWPSSARRDRQSDLALAIADALGGDVAVEVVNADAMQLYRGMDIGTAKLPSRNAAGLPTIISTFSTSPRPRRWPATSRPRAADVEAITARGAFRSSSAGRCCTSSRCSTSGRSRPPTRRCGPVGQRLADVGVAALHERARRGRPRSGRVDPAHRRQAHRAGAGGRGADGSAVRGVGADASERRGGTPRSSDWIGIPSFSTTDWPAGPTRCSREGLVDEVHALVGRGLRDGVTAARALGYAQVLADLDARRRRRRGARTDVHRHAPVRAQAAVLVPPRSPHHLARRCRVRHVDEVSASGGNGARAERPGE